MGLDGICLRFLSEEMKTFCVGARVEKIYQPSRYELVLSLRTREGKGDLFISVGGNSPRINLTKNVFDNPATPPMLCMLLRKVLCGAIITDIRQAGCDRILFVDFSATNDIGDRVARTLAVEIMAQYSNCILIDENGDIIDSLKRVDSTKSSFREVLPKLRYILPPQQDKLDITSSGADDVMEKLNEYSAKTVPSALLSVISGLSPALSREIAFRAGAEEHTVSALGENEKKRLYSEISALKEMLMSGKAQPVVMKTENGTLTDFSYMPLTMYFGAAKAEKVPSLSEALDMFYTEKERLARTKTRADDLFRTLSVLSERIAKKITVQSGELAECDSAEEKRIYAELINANLYSLEKGASVYRVQNYYDDYKETVIPVSPLLTPSQNSQKYYKEYRKLQTAKKVLTEQLEKGRADLEYLATVRDELERASSEKEISAIRAELSAGGFLKSKTGLKNKKNISLPPFEFVSPSGYTVLIGRNNIQNDELSLKKAKKGDIWFHTQKAPGSHVILCCAGENPSPADMEYAASAAAYYSSVRAGGLTEVDYTEVKNLKKPPSSRPGFVIYHVYSTLHIAAADPRKTEKTETDD